MVSSVMKQLIDHGEVRRGRIGVAVQDLTPDLAEALKLTDSSGAVVGSVEGGSPAAHAVLQAGDVIVSIDNYPISGSADLRNRIGLTPVGSEVAVEYLRDGARKSVTIRIAPENAAAAAPSQPDPLEGAQDAAGNVFVSQVDEGSAAARAGLRAGDVIVAINRKPVASVAELRAALREASGTIAMDLFRGGAKLFLVVPS